MLLFEKSQWKMCSLRDPLILGLAINFYWHRSATSKLYIFRIMTTLYDLILSYISFRKVTEPLDDQTVPKYRILKNTVWICTIPSDTLKEILYRTVTTKLLTTPELYRNCIQTSQLGYGTRPTVCTSAF